MSQTISLSTLLVFIFVGLPAATAGEIDVYLGDSSVQIEGKSLQKGDSVFFLMVSWPDQPWIPKLETNDEIVTVEKEGKATLSWPGRESIPFRTLVVAVNPRDGNYGVGAPQGFPVNEETLLEAAFLVNGDSGLIDAIRIHGRRFEYLVVRPGIGAWRLKSRDGSLNDLDGVSDRVSTASLGATQFNLRYGAAPASLASGDVVIAIDARTMSIIAGGVS